MPTGIKINVGIPNKGYGRPTACDVSSSEHAVTFENVENDMTAFINPHSAGIDFRRQNLTSVDVRF